MQMCAVLEFEKYRPQNKMKTIIQRLEIQIILYQIKKAIFGGAPCMGSHNLNIFSHGNTLRSWFLWYFDVCSIENSLE